MEQLVLNIEVEITPPPVPPPPVPSPKDCWQTPPAILRLVKSAFAVSRVLVDPCTSSANNVGADLYYTHEDDGLSKPWKCPIDDGIDFNAYVNPPYSNPAPWIEAINAKIESEVNTFNPGQGVVRKQQANLGTFSSGN